MARLVDEALAMICEVGPIDAMKWLAEESAKEEREACIDIVETYRIPVGNSAAGEMACEWTYDALKEIRDDMRSRGDK